MSFRYTNNLIGVLKHRLAIESAHREIARRTFTGTCNGVEVTCSGYGTVLAIRLLDKKTWEPFYTRRSPSASFPTPSSPSLQAELAAEAADARAHHGAVSGGGGIDLTKLSQSIQTATWEANRLVRAAKEEAHARAVLHNTQSRAKGSLRDWYEVDATSLHPRPFDALKQEAATPWMQAVRFAKPNPSAYFTHSSSSSPSPSESESPPHVGRVTVLGEEDCDPLAIPIGATHPLHVPALTQLESFSDARSPAAVSEDDAHDAISRDGRVRSRLNTHAVLVEHRKETARDEAYFWERVELIRRGQLASLGSAANVKRGYADMAAVVADGVEDKVELKFTQ